MTERAPHPKDGITIDDCPNVVVNEEGFHVAKFRYYNDAQIYVETINREHPCACYGIEGEQT